MVNTITFGLSQSQLAGDSRVAGRDDKAPSEPPSADRTVRDTIEISADGQKIVNLARGAELAAELPDAAEDRQAFDAALKKAQEDIKRITDLFGGVLGQGVGTRSASSFAPDQAGGANAPSGAEFAATLRQALEDVRKIPEQFSRNLQDSARRNAG